MRTINKILILPFLLLSAVLPAWAYDSAPAEKAYGEGNYELAAALYSEALLREGTSAGLLYDLGNCYYQLGKEADAMLCYERARRLDPSNTTIRGNLEFLTSRVLDSNKAELKGRNINLDADPESITDRLYRIIAIDHKSNGWAVFAVIAFILFVGAVALYTFTPNILARKTGFFSGLVFLGFTVIFIVFSYLAANKASKADEAILMSFTSELLDQPAHNARPATTPLHKGTKLKILGEKKGPDGTEWIQVRLNSDNVGWIKKHELEII